MLSSILSEIQQYNEGVPSQKFTKIHL